ncbi:MAG: hypothetical protein JWP03_4904 [Phycisphaerales bacterium]|nr:hypothetical protein [Phycisphaerales bacterium]
MQLDGVFHWGTPLSDGPCNAARVGGLYISHSCDFPGIGAFKTGRTIHAAIRAESFFRPSDNIDVPAAGWHSDP